MVDDAMAGPMLVIRNLGALGASLLLLTLWVAIGARTRRAIAPGAPHLGAGTRWPVDAALGAGALATLLLPFGALGWMRAPVVLALTLLCGALARREWGGALAECWSMISSLRDRPLAGALPVAGAVLLVALLGAGALAPPTEWDSLMYHLPIPLWFLETGRIAVPPDSFHVALVGASHLATLPLLAVGIVSGPAIMQVATFALVLCGTQALALATGIERDRSWVAVAIVIGCPVFVLVAITPRVDVALVSSLLAAHLVLLGARARGSSREVILAAVLVGFAIAIKPQAGAYAIALLPLGWRAAGSARAALIAAGVAATAAVPWFIKNQLLVGAPLYPKGAPGWLEPWIASVFGSKVPPEGFDLSILRALPESRESFDVLDAFFEPGRLTIEGEGAYYALSPLLLALPLALLVWRKHRAALLVGVVGIVYAALVVVPFGRINLRYLMPAIPALAVATAAAVQVIAARLGRAALRLGAVTVLLAATWPIGITLRARFLGGDQVLLRHAAGLVSPREVWERHPDGTSRSFLPVVENVRRLVPEGGRVLMLWEARTHPFGRDMIADVLLSNWSYLAQSPALENCLAGTGITHVLAGSGALNYYLARGADQRAFRLGQFGGFRDRCLTGYAVVAPGFEFFEVLPSRVPDTPPAP